MDESIHLDEAVSGPASAGTPDQALLETVDPTFRARLERIQDHRAEAQDHPDSRYAAVAALNADLMEVALYVGVALRRFMTAEPATIDGIETSSGSTDLLMRLSKQVAQLCNLEIYLGKSSGEVTSPIRPR